MSIVAMILGIVGLLLSCILIGIIPCVVSLILSIIAIKDKKSHINMAIAGLVTSVIGIIVFILMMIFISTSAEKTDNASVTEEVTKQMFQDESSKSIEDKILKTEDSTQFGTELSLQQSEEMEMSQSTAEEQADEEAALSEEDRFLLELSGVLDEDIIRKIYNILSNKIGFTEIKYVGQNAIGNSNYDFESAEYNFTVTASDDVYRIFQPNGGAVFYEDGEVRNSVADIKGKTIDSYDRSAYYIMAQGIVEQGLKNPRSAKFPSIITRPEEISMAKNGDIIAVQSYVDAQNSFGATVRSNWTAQFMVVNISTYSHEPLYLNIDGVAVYGEWINME